MRTSVGVGSGEGVAVGNAVAVGGLTLVGVGVAVGDNVSVGSGVLVSVGVGLQATSSIPNARAPERADMILDPRTFIAYQPNDGLDGLYGEAKAI